MNSEDRIETQNLLPEGEIIKKAKDLWNGFIDCNGPFIARLIARDSLNMMKEFLDTATTDPDSLTRSNTFGLLLFFRGSGVSMSISDTHSGTTIALSGMKGDFSCFFPTDPHDDTELSFDVDSERKTYWDGVIKFPSHLKE